MIDDWDLLRKWVTDGAQDAFAEIVNRRINLVYASARRRLGDDHAAEDVTQAVFLLLSQRAETLRRRESLPAWLFTAVRYTAANAIKMQRRRDHHEHLAAKGKSMTATMENDPEISRGLLDESIDKLSTSDRTALLLRFFQEKSLADVGAAMGIGENAAEKRVSRAVGRLRKILLGSTGDSQAVLSALATSAAEVAPSQLGATVIGTMFAGANAGAKITLLTRAAGRSMARAAGGFVVATVTIMVLVIVAVSAFVAQRNRPAPPPAPAKAVAAAAQTDLIAQVLQFDVVVKQPTDDPATLLRQAHDGIAAAEQKLRNLRTNSIIKYEKQNSAGQWTSAGEIDQTLWIENTQTERFRDDVHNSVTEWTGGTAPFYREKFIVVCDGSSSKRLTTAGGAPQAFQPHLEGRISASNFGPSGSPWGQTIYGAIDQRTSPPSPKLRLSETLAPGLGASARQVTLNGRECVELSLKRPMEETLFVDPSHGWALVGYDWSVPQRIVERYVVKELMPAGQGIEIPADVVGVVMPGQRFELRTTAAVANDPAWSEKLFQLEWPPELTAVWDDRTHTVIRFPAKASPGATQSSGEHGL
jgi:RNA polymerase sigma factor (sigma-70 family)